MTFTRYPQYKESGVQWLGKVPEHWDVARLGHYFTERREKVSDVDFSPLSVTKAGVVPQLSTAAKTDDNDNRKRVHKGDFVINSRSDRNGSAGVSELDGSVSLINTVLRPQELVHPPFVHHLLRSKSFQEEFYRFGKGIVADLWSTNYSEMRNIVLAIPCLREQRLIAAFLDRELTKIDALVAEQQRLIKLLKEKRDAAIARSSPVPSVGRTTRLGNLIELRPGYAFPSEYFSTEAQGLRLLRGINVGVGQCRWDDTVYWTGPVDSKVEEFSLAVGDLLLGMDRPWIAEGTRVAEVSAADVPSLLVQRVARIRMRAGVVPRFVRYVLSSRAFRSYLEADLTGVSVPHISEEQITSFPTPILNESEQWLLANEIAETVARVELLIGEAERAITLLQERRGVLECAAVTGKIEVRDSAHTATA